jgi:hypothetical protein
MASETEDKLASLESHITDCPQCSRTQKRVNDFCRVGKVLFFDWTKGGTEHITRAEVLGESESQKIIADAEKQQEKARNN